MDGFGTFLVICAACGVLPPARWGSRLWVLLALPAATLLILTPTPQWVDRGILDGLGQAIVVLGLTFILAGIGGRWLLGRALAQALKRTRPVGDREARALRLLDGLLATVAGLCVGLFLTLAVALLLRGAPGGLGLHLAVVVLALGAAGWLLRHAEGLARPAAVAALGALAGLALLGGLAWPRLIESRVAASHPDLPRCLRAVDHPARVEETMLLTLPRGRPGAPGLILTVMAPEGPMHYRWSYRANGFVSYHAYRHGACPA
jgi:hypothetical protein